MELVLNTVIVLNMANDPEYEMFQHPVGFAFVCSVEPFEVYWFQCNEDQLQAKPKGKLARAFRHSYGTRPALKYLTVMKYWDNPDWFRPSRKGHKPTENQILANWHRSHAHRNWVIPITVPQPAHNKVLMNDSLKLDMTWIKDTLLPVCEEAGCYQFH